jgi:hypothetical protein
MRSAGKVFTQAGTISLNVDVWDEAWNTDFCIVELNIRTENTGSRIAKGTVSTEQGEAVMGVAVTVDMALPEYPMTVFTGENGLYGANIDDTRPFTLVASKNNDFDNGISTLDLVLIQRHLLGIQDFTSSYQYIAADANNDSRVTATDLTELRKVVLGITSRFANESWRFVVAGTSVQTTYPITFTEVSDKENTDFIAVKIGDVNSSAALNVKNINTESRSVSKLVMTVDAADVMSGEVVRVPVMAGNFADVAGFQYTMNLDGASYVGIESGAIDMTAANVGVISTDVVTMSYATSESVTVAEGDVLFTLVLRADKAVNVADVMSITSEVTASESYTSELKVGKVEMAVRTAEAGEIVLMQNEPNPFKSYTKVSFEMPEAAEATITVTDVAGKVIAVRNINAERGLNTVEFTREEISVSGVAFYTLTSGEFTATKKMIIID